MAFLYDFTEWGIKYYDCKKRLILESFTKGNICKPAKFLFLAYWCLLSKIYRFTNWTSDNFLKKLYEDLWFMSFCLSGLYLAFSCFLLINQQPEVPTKLQGTSGSLFHSPAHWGHSRTALQLPSRLRSPAFLPLLEAQALSQAKVSVIYLSCESEGLLHPLVLL